MTFFRQSDRLRVKSRHLLAIVIAFSPLKTYAHSPYAKTDVLSRSPSQATPEMTKSEFTSGSVTGAYSLFQPPKAEGVGPRPLVVMLHGCTQSAEIFSQSTRMNEIALQENFAVLYPEQNSEANQLRCWSWFDPINQTRVAGRSEREWLASLVNTVANQINADRSRIYIAGLSAGAAMTVVMLSCHPELFAAGAVNAGVSFGAASDALSGSKAMQDGSSFSPAASAAKALECEEPKVGKPVSVLVVQGSDDKVVRAVNAKQILRHFESLNDLRDDGNANQSFKFNEQTAKPGAKRKGTYASTIQDFTSEKATARLVTVKKLGHAWSGGKGGIEYSDPKGPSASEMAWGFFNAR